MHRNSKNKLYDMKIDDHDELDMAINENLNHFGSLFPDIDIDKTLPLHPENDTRPNLKTRNSL